MKDTGGGKGANGGSAGFNLIFGITMLVIGVQHQHECQNSGALYLEVQGGFMLFAVILAIVGIAAPEPAPLIAGIVAAVGQLAILIWGSVVIFGKSDSFFKMRIFQ